MDGWHMRGGGKLMQGWGELGQKAMSLPEGFSLMPAGVPAGWDKAQVTSLPALLPSSGCAGELRSPPVGWKATSFSRDRRDVLAAVRGYIPEPPVFVFVEFLAIRRGQGGTSFWTSFWKFFPSFLVWVTISRTGSGKRIEK